MKNLQLPQRKATRLKGYDYSSPGVYFITICTQNRKCMLSDLVVGEGLAPPETRLSEIGRIAEEQILALEERFPPVSIDRYVVMPNHIHILLLLREQAGGARAHSRKIVLSSLQGRHGILSCRFLLHQFIKRYKTD